LSLTADIESRLQSLHLEGLPREVELRERDRLCGSVERHIPRGSIERDIGRSEHRKAFLSMLWRWHRLQLLFASEGSVTAFGERRGKHDSKPPKDIDPDVADLSYRVFDPVRDFEAHILSQERV
jgi:hypothetical protein